MGTRAVQHAFRSTSDANDTLRKNKTTDCIFTGANDHFDRTQGSAFTEVKPAIKPPSNG